MTESYLSVHLIPTRIVTSMALMTPMTLVAVVRRNQPAGILFKGIREIKSIWVTSSDCVLFSLVVHHGDRGFGLSDAKLRDKKARTNKNKVNKFSHRHSFIG